MSSPAKAISLAVAQHWWLVFVILVAVVGALEGMGVLEPIDYWGELVTWR